MFVHVQNLSVLREHCNDPALSVRKQALQSLTDLMDSFPLHTAIQKYVTSSSPEYRFHFAVSLWTKWYLHHCTYLYLVLCVAEVMLVTSSNLIRFKQKNLQLNTVKLGLYQNTYNIHATL